MDVKKKKKKIFNRTLLEVCMKPQLGTFPSPKKVVLLHRALYGLKQAPPAWFATFSSTITQLEFTFSPMKQHYLHDRLLIVFVFFLFILITWLLQVMILRLYLIYNVTLETTLKWKVLDHSVIFMNFRSHPTLMDTIYLKQNKFLISWLNLILLTLSRH